MKNNQLPRRNPSSLVVAGLFLWILAPIALIAGLTWLSSQQSVTEKAEAVWVPADPIDGTYSRVATLAVSWAEPTPVVAPDWAGLVRDVFVQPESQLSSGDYVAQIDAVSRVAWHSEKPFYRSLTQGDSGSDVQELHSLLEHFSFEYSTGDKFTPQTARGVNQLAVALGAEKTGVFDPSWIVFLPAKEVTVDSVQLAVGLPAPATGEPLMTLAQAMTGARLSAPEGGAIIGNSVAAEPGEQLVFRDSIYQLEDDSLTLTQEALELLTSNISSGTTPVTASLERELTASSVEVPSAAVHTSPSGEMCVRVRPALNGPQETAQERVIPVETLAGLAGRTVLTGDLAAGDQVAVGAFTTGAACE